MKTGVFWNGDGDAQIGLGVERSQGGGLGFHRWVQRVSTVDVDCVAMAGRMVKCWNMWWCGWVHGLQLNLWLIIDD
jgi:hypothetical protein